MKHHILVACMIAACLGTAKAESPSPEKRVASMISDAETKLPALERSWMDAWQKKDRATCERILGDDFLLTSARGILMSKKEWLDAAMGPFVCDDFAWEEIKVRSFGDVAIVHARARQQASVEGKDWSGVFLLTDVWVFRHGAWQVVSRHGTGPLGK